MTSSPPRGFAGSFWLINFPVISPFGNSVGDAAGVASGIVVGASPPGCSACAHTGVGTTNSIRLNRKTGKNLDRKFIGVPFLMGWIFGSDGAAAGWAEAVT